MYVCVWCVCVRACFWDIGSRISRGHYMLQLVFCCITLTISQSVSRMDNNHAGQCRCSVVLWLLVSLSQIDYCQ